MASTQQPPCQFTLIHHRGYHHLGTAKCFLPKFKPFQLMWTFICWSHDLQRKTRLYVRLSHWLKLPGGDCHVKWGLYSMCRYAYIYARIHWHTVSASVILLLPTAPSIGEPTHQLSPSKFKHVELSRSALTSAGIPANQKSALRSLRTNTLFYIRMYTDIKASVFILSL